MSMLDGVFGVIRTVVNGATSLPNRASLTFSKGIQAVDDAGGNATVISLVNDSRSGLVTALSSPGTYDGQKIVCDGYYARGDGGGGQFVWDSASTATAVAGMVIGTGTGRWIRIYSGAANVRWFGAKGDAVTNDGAAIQSAMSTLPSGATLYFPPGTYLSNGAITRVSSISVVGDRATLLRGSTTGALLKIYGEVGTRIAHARVLGLTFDGADSGSIVYGSPYAYDLCVQYCDDVQIRDARFINTRYNSAYITDCGKLICHACEFADGVTSSGTDSATTAFHLQVNNVDFVGVDGVSWSHDCTYDAGGAYGGSNPQGAVATCAPIALFATRCGRIAVKSCSSNNAGGFDFYDGCAAVLVASCEFFEPQMPAVKVQNFARATVRDNIVTSPQHYWGSVIYLSAFTRLSTYGSLDQYQGSGVVAGNQIAGAKCREGAISHSGSLYSTANLDDRILADVAAGRTTNRVTKSGGSYYYTDYDGNVSPAINQEYLKARSLVVGQNVIDGFATYGVSTYLVKNVKALNNLFPKGAEVDTPYAYAKSFISLTEFDGADVTGNTLQMALTDIPMVSTVATAVNGISLSCTAVTSAVGTANIEGNTVKINECGVGISLLDMHSASVCDNAIKPLTFFDTSSAFVKSTGGIITKGRISGNIRSLDDAGTTPSASTLYLAEQGGFLSLEKTDQTYTIVHSRRVVADPGDYTGPQQVASGYYALGSQIVVDVYDTKRYYRCETAGYLAPAYAGGTTYARGQKVVSGGEYFVALQSTTGNTPTAGTGDSYWRYLSATAAAFTEIVL